MKREIRKAKLKYFNNLLDKNKRNPRKFWEVVNDLRGKKNNKEKIEIKNGNERLDSEEKTTELANLFNKYFNEIPEILLAEHNMFGKMREANNTSSRLAVLNKSNIKINEIIITEANVHKAILNLKNT